MGVLVDAFARAQIAVNKGSAAAALDGRAGQVLTISSVIG
jgi:hypothetical protein